MSEYSSSGNLFSNNIFSLFLLVTGFSLLLLGHAELQIFLDGLSAYLPIRPDQSTVWLLILGFSLATGGFISLYRNYLYSSEEKSLD